MPLIVLETQEHRSQHCQSAANSYVCCSPSGIVIVLKTEKVGFAGTVVGHPFDTIKVRLQNQDGHNPRYRGTFHCFTEILRKESVRGLFKGMASPLACQVFINAIVFGVQGNTIKRLNDKGFNGQFISGAIAGGVQSIVCCPMELVKTRLQLQGQGETLQQLRSHISASSRYEYSSPVDCVEKLYKYEGIRGLYRGMVSTTIREVPSFGLYFASYFSLCNYLGAADGDSLNVMKLLLCGGVSGMITWLVTYPVDVVKTRLQADGLGKNAYNGMIDCAVKSYRQEGASVFFRGLNATLIRAFPTNAATLSTVSLFLHFVHPESLPEFFRPESHYNYEHVRPGWSI